MSEMTLRISRLHAFCRLNSCKHKAVLISKQHIMYPGSIQLGMQMGECIPQVLCKFVTSNVGFEGSSAGFFWADNTKCLVP